jgi:hypothetical protein
MPPLVDFLPGVRCSVLRSPGDNERTGKGITGYLSVERWLSSMSGVGYPHAWVGSPHHSRRSARKELQTDTCLDAFPQPAEVPTTTTNYYRNKEQSSRNCSSREVLWAQAGSRHGCDTLQQAR